MNERITENILRDLLRKAGYYKSKGDITVEEQISKIVEVSRLLKSAGKAGKGGKGSPEFIISSISVPDFIIIFECKSDVKKHESKERNKPQEYAVDGILHYAKYLSKAFNVIAVAVSGQTLSSLKISSFIFPKNSNQYKDLTNKSKKVIKSILTFDEYIEYGTFDELVAQNRHDNLMAFSRELHDFMRDYAKLTESEKPLLVSGTLIALRNKAFASSFELYSPDELQKQWFNVIQEEIKKAKIPHSKEASMTQPYSSIAVHPELGKPTKRYPKGIMYELIKMLNDKVWPFISIYHDFDVVGQFYGEFLKYTGGDKKALGIVLTPRHVTELFSLIANLKKDSRVLDTCAGTGGFLISAMRRMMTLAVTTQDKENIKKEGLVGVEQQPSMYALAASNMILRGDGKANLYQGSCFNETIIKEIKKHHCNVGMINPPYSQSDEDLQELVFVNNLLNCIEKGGTGIVIVPVTCATSPHPLRDEILKYHTLEAVMSMPTDLFYPVGIVTCIMVFTAHIPHESSNKKTWFGYWKYDGYIKTKHLGRVDLNHKWAAIRDHWITTFRNRDEIPGQCVKRYVGAQDEWVAEAYLETDYDSLTKNDFEDVVKNYLIFKVMNNISDEKS